MTPEIEARLLALSWAQFTTLVDKLRMDRHQFSENATQAHRLQSFQDQMTAHGVSSDTVADALPRATNAPDTFSRRHQLPPEPTTFVGRKADLEKLREMRAQSGTAVITGLRGMGGIGKTALALMLAHEWKDQYPAAQLWLDGRGTHENPPSPEALLAQVIQAFHPESKPPEKLENLKQVYHALLQSNPSLIVLDNAWNADQAKVLTPPTGSALIVTSRQGFVIDGNKPLHVGKLPDDEATALLRKLYPALNDADAAALVKLCCGLPLALRLAGAHLGLDASEQPGGKADVSGYIKALRSGRLATLDADAPDAGEITISETLRLSEERLAEPERTAWRKLAVFASSFDPRAAEAIAAADEALLTRLMRRSLLEREENQRFKLHDLAIEYALTKLSEAEVQVLLLVHAQHYIVVGREASSLYQKGQQVEGLGLFDQERMQVEAALGWLSSQAGEETARSLVKLVNTMVDIGSLRLHPKERIVWLETQLSAARRLGLRDAEGAALGNLGIAHSALGDARKAIEFYQQQLTISREAGDRGSECNGLVNLAVAYKNLGEMRAAIGFNEKALAISREIGDRRIESAALGNLGVAHDILGETQKAIGFYEQDLLITREVGNRRGEGNALGNLGIAYKNLGNTHKAIELYEQRHVIAREIGDRRGAGSALGNLGSAHGILGDECKAIEFLEQALAIYREIGDLRNEGNTLGNLGVAYRRLGDAHKAIQLYEQRLVIAHEIGDRRGEGSSLWNAAVAYKEVGDRNKAITCAEAALRLFESIEDPGTPMVLAELLKWRSEL